MSNFWIKFNIILQTAVSIILFSYINFCRWYTKPFVICDRITELSIIVQTMDRTSAYWTRVVAIFYPSLDAFGMKIVSSVALQLSHRVRRLVINKADSALRFMPKVTSIEWYFTEAAQNFYDLNLVQLSVWVTCLFLQICHLEIYEYVYEWNGAK